MTTRKEARDCNSMAELRKEIDAIDTMLVDILAKRTEYIDRAVALKREEGLPARTVDRGAEVLTNVKSLATQSGWDPELAATIWTALIEWSIVRESKDLGH